MHTNRRNIALRTIAQSRRVARWPETPGPDGLLLNPRPGPVLLDWEHAVRAAAARLAGQSASPDASVHPLIRGQAAWQAALITAFGKLAEEVERLRVRTMEPLISHEDEPGSVT